MTHPFTVTRYPNAATFLKQVGPVLEENEVEHTFVIWEASTLVKKDNPGQVYCGAVWTNAGDDDKKLTFAMIGADGGTAYCSLLLNTADRLAIQLLVSDAMATQMSFKKIHGYAPWAQIFSDGWTTSQFQLRMTAWVYQLTKIPQQSTDGYFEKATTKDFPLLLTWTTNFLEDCQMTYLGRPQDFYEEDVSNGNVYLWYENKEPVSMVWRRRQNRKGCSLGFVYTPPEHRGKGCGARSVSKICDMILNDDGLEYVTLNARGDQDPKYNLYTKLGFEFVGTLVQYDCP